MRPAAPSSGPTGHSPSAGSASPSSRSRASHGSASAWSWLPGTSTTLAAGERAAQRLERGRATSSASASGRSRSSSASPSTTRRSAPATASTSASSGFPPRATSAPAKPPMWRSDTTAVRTPGMVSGGREARFEGRVAVLPPQPLRRRVPDLLEGDGARPQPPGGAAAAAELHAAARGRSARPRRPPARACREGRSRPRAPTRTDARCGSRRSRVACGSPLGTGDSS